MKGTSCNCTTAQCNPMEDDTFVNRVNYMLFSQMTHPQTIHIIVVPMVEQKEEHVLQSMTGESNYKPRQTLFND